MVVALAVIVALGGGLRLASATDPNREQRGDWLAYESISKTLYEDGSYAGDDLRFPEEFSPGLPLMAAGVYTVTGGAFVERALIASALLGMVMILLVYLLARRLVRARGEVPPWSAPAAGLVAATGAALYPTYIDYADRLVTEPVAACLVAASVLAFLWALDRPGARAFLAPGLLLGLTTLTRPEYLAVSVAFGALALVLVARRHGRGGGVRAAVLLLAACAAVLAPWTVRNYVVLDRVVPVSTGGGRAIFVGTFLPGRGQNVKTRQVLNGRFGLNETRTDPLLDIVAREYPELERDAALGRIGRENLSRYLRDDPLAYAGMLAEKASTIWRRGLGMDGFAGLVVHWSFLLLGGGALVGLARSRRAEALVLGLPIAGITALGALLLAPPRRNVPLMPLLFALSGVAVVWLSVWARAAVRARRERVGVPA